jgi:hypothetical protein
MSAPAIGLLGFYSRRWGVRAELGIGYVAAAARAAGFEAEIWMIDPEDDRSAVARILSGRAFGIVGLAFSHAALSLGTMGRLIADVRRAVPAGHITAGGYFATFNADRLLQAFPDLDSVVVGEGEATMVELAHRLARGQDPARGQDFARAQDVAGVPGLKTRTAPFVARPPIGDLDDLPPPPREVEAGLDLFSLSTSRGCLAHCTFCNVPAWTRRHGGGWRGRSAANVADELQALAALTPVPRVWIVDSSYEDSPDGGFERMSAIAREILSRRLTLRYYVFVRAESVCAPGFAARLPELIASGLRRVFVGVETGDDRQLKAFAKSARAAHHDTALAILRGQGLAVRAGWIMFAPDLELDALPAKVDQLERLGLLHSTIDLFTCLEVYAGSSKVRKLETRGLLRPEHWHDPYAYDFVDPRLARLARAMVRIREESAHAWDGEAMHTAELVLAGARHEPVADADRPARDALVAAAEERLQKVKALQAAANRLFLEEAIERAREPFDEAGFAETVERHIRDFHRPTARAARAIGARLVDDLGARNVQVRY